MPMLGVSALMWRSTRVVNDPTGHSPTDTSTLLNADPGISDNPCSSWPLPVLAVVLSRLVKTVRRL
jgi:hypothetical protein